MFMEVLLFVLIALLIVLICLNLGVGLYQYRKLSQRIDTLTFEVFNDIHKLHDHLDYISVKLDMIDDMIKKIYVGRDGRL